MEFVCPFKKWTTEAIESALQKGKKIAVPLILLALKQVDLTLQAEEVALFFINTF
jgi:hypothetical protein